MSILAVHRTVSFLAVSACAFVAIATSASCSSEDTPSSSGVPEAQDGSARDGSTQDDLDGSSAVDGAMAPDVSTDASGAGGRGITITVDGTTHTLTEGSRAAKQSIGVGIQAAKTEGTKLYGVTILLRKRSTSGDNEDIAPGTYTCSASTPPSPHQWARIQYTSPDGTFQYGNPAPCVTLTEFGDVGQPVVGTFDAILEPVSGGGPAVTVSGTFDVDRTE